jgi:preprotein translocase subunit SecE
MANKVANFLKEVKIELGKVSWSSREDLTSSAIVVITSMFLLGIFIWICDFVFVRMVNVVIKL